MFRIKKKIIHNFLLLLEIGLHTLDDSRLVS